MKNSQRSCTHTLKLPLILLLLTVLSALLSIGLGQVRLNPVKAAAALFGGGSEAERAIIQLVRLPRTGACLLSGMSLAVSGAVIQSVLNNPLAAPNIIGVNSGAGLAAVICCALLPAQSVLLPAAAFAGALLAVLLVLLLSRKAGASRMTVVLAGVAVSSVLTALIDAVLTFVPDALSGYSDFRIGSFANIQAARLLPAAVVAAIALLGIALLHNEMDLLTLGPQTAAALGLNVRRVRRALLIFAAALAGASVSLCGLLGFVGLIVPHMMRRIAGEGSGRLMLCCALGGASLVTLCDVLSRVLFAPYELPAGILLSCIGGPFFLWLLIKRRGGHRYD